MGIDNTIPKLPAMTRKNSNDKCCSTVSLKDH